MAEQAFQLDALDHLANEAFPGLVVRKDLLRRMRSAFSVPAFVIEFLLGKYCSSTDEETINEGLEFVRETLASKYVKPDESRLWAYHPAGEPVEQDERSYQDGRC